MARSVTATWNVALGRKLWDEDKSYSEIAKACKVTKSAIGGYADRHWPARDCDVERYAELLEKRNRAKTLQQNFGKARMLATGEATLPPLKSLTYDGVGPFEG